MKTKHTKGNWSIHTSEKGNKYLISGDNWINFCKVFIHASGRSREEARANAQLIVSAPKMLHELTEIVEYINKMGAVSIAMQTIKNRAKEAIKKATE